MKRGILELTLYEFAELVERINPEHYVGTPLGNKIFAAGQVEDDVETIRIQVSEDELEALLDDGGVPGPDDSDDAKSMRKKINDTLTKFRAIF